jgi:hypothetical protein
VHAPIFFCWHLFVSCSSVNHEVASVLLTAYPRDLNDVFPALTLLLPPVRWCSSCADFIPAPTDFILPWSSCVPLCFSIRCSISCRCIKDSFSIADAHQDFLFFGRVLPNACLRVLLQTVWPRFLLPQLSSQSGALCRSSSRARGLCFPALNFSLLSRTFSSPVDSAGCLREQHRVGLVLELPDQKNSSFLSSNRFHMVVC